MYQTLTCMDWARVSFTHTATHADIRWTVKCESRLALTHEAKCSVVAVPRLEHVFCEAGIDLYGLGTCFVQPHGYTCGYQMNSQMRINACIDT